MLPTADHLRRILEAGLCAPSAENKHYLRFQTRGDTVRLLATDTASWAELPHRRMLALLSYGAVIENISLRSLQCGYALRALLSPDLDQPERIADLHWTASSAPPDPLCNAIEQRHTNRCFYRRAPLPEQTRDGLTAATAAIPGARLLWLDDPGSRRLALRAIHVAEAERFRRRELHQELFGAVRFEAGWTDTVDEWLAPAALEVERPMRRAFASLRHWPLMRAATWLGVHQALGFRAGYLPCALSPHIGLVLARGSGDAPANLDAGRALERLWLKAASDGLALQPMAAATALIRQRPGKGWVSMAAKSHLEQLLRALHRDVDAQPYMLFRLGRARAPSAVSGRRPLEHYAD